MPARRSIPVLGLAIAMPLLAAAARANEDAGESRVRKVPAISFLPDGSELEGVVLPRYDAKLRLTGALHADKLTLIGDGLIRGDGVRIDLLNPDRPGDRTRIELGGAMLDQAGGVIRADEKVTVASARFTATGAALHFSFEEGRGFVSGPATTRIHATPRTAMRNPSATTRHPMLATTALGMAVATGAVAHARPPAVSPGEVAELRETAASSAAEIRDHAGQSREIIRETRETAEAISLAARTYLVNQVLEPGEFPPAAPERPDPAPLEIEAMPEDTRILSDGGFYFDASEGVLVYLENVRVSDPRFTLEGIDELKVIFAKDSGEESEAGDVDGTDGRNGTDEDETAPARQDPADAFADGIGEVERIIATGRVRFTQREPQDGKAPIEASGAMFNYDVESGEIILSGGYPWVRQGGYYARALEPELNLRIRRDGSFVTEGSWDTGQNIRR